MSGYDGSGNFNFTFSWANDASNGIPITASRMDTQFTDAQNGFDLVICNDGQSTTTALIPFAAGISTGAGVSFPAVQAPSSDPNTLDDYEELPWEPADSSGAGLIFTVTDAFYIKIGKQITAQATLTFPANASGAAVTIAGLPAYTIRTNAFACAATNTNASLQFVARLNPSTGLISLLNSSNVAITNSQMSGFLLSFTLTYFTAA